MHRIGAVYALHGFFHLFWRFQAHGHVDAPDDEHAFFSFHFAGYIGRQSPITGVECWRASSAPPKVPIIQPAVAEMT